MKDVPEDELRKKGGVDNERVPLGGGGFKRQGIWKDEE